MGGGGGKTTGRGGMGGGLGSTGPRGGDGVVAADTDVRVDKLPFVIGAFAHWRAPAGDDSRGTGRLGDAHNRNIGTGSIW
jgi:hypothetical protein